MRVRLFIVDRLCAFQRSSIYQASIESSPVLGPFLISTQANECQICVQYSYVLVKSNYMGCSGQEGFYNKYELFQVFFIRNGENEHHPRSPSAVIFKDIFI